MSKQKFYDDLLLRDIPALKADVGFQSRYSDMSDDYKPLVVRVVELEEKIDALLKHLGVDIIKERNVVIPKEARHDQS